MAKSIILLLTLSNSMWCHKSSLTRFLTQCKSQVKQKKEQLMHANNSPWSLCVSAFDLPVNRTKNYVEWHMVQFPSFYIHSEQHKWMRINIVTPHPPSTKTKRTWTRNHRIKIWNDGMCDPSCVRIFFEDDSVTIWPAPGSHFGSFYL